MKFLRYISFFLLASMCIACTEDHHIKLEKDGSANVTYHLEFVDSDTTSGAKKDSSESAQLKDSLRNIFEAFYKSPLISNYECTVDENLNVTVAYRISDVNELGKFLSPFLATTVTFKNTKHKFTIDAGNGNANPEDDIGGYTNLLLFNLTIELPKKIKNMENLSGLPVNYSGNKATISSNIGTVNYSGKRNLVVLKY